MSAFQDLVECLHGVRLVARDWALHAAPGVLAMLPAPPCDLPEQDGAPGVLVMLPAPPGALLELALCAISGGTLNSIPDPPKLNLLERKRSPILPYQGCTNLGFHAHGSQFAFKLRSIQQLHMAVSYCAD